MIDANEDWLSATATQSTCVGIANSKCSAQGPVATPAPTQRACVEMHVDTYELINAMRGGMRSEWAASRTVQ